MVLDLIEIIGDPSRHGQSISLAPLLSLFDVLAGRCAAIFSGGAVVTGSFDDVRLFSPLKHGDLIAAVAEVVSVGRCSMLLRVQASAFAALATGAKPELIARYVWRALPFSVFSI